jgi:hypothetical protein
MISPEQIRRFFLSIILTVMLAITIAFDSGVSESWAAKPFPQISSPSPIQIATNKNAESKTQKPFGVMSGSGDSQAQSAAKTEQFKAKTLEGMNNSIDNPNYQPGGKTKGAEKQDREANKEIKAEAMEAMESNR